MELNKGKGKASETAELPKGKGKQMTSEEIGKRTVDLSRGSHRMDGINDNFHRMMKVGAVNMEDNPSKGKQPEAVAGNAGTAKGKQDSVDMHTHQRSSIFVLPPATRDASEEDIHSIAAAFAEAVEVSVRDTPEQTIAAP